MFADTENIAALPWIQNEGPGSTHTDKKDLVDILLTWKNVGLLTAKNVFQLLKKCDPQASRSRAGSKKSAMRGTDRLAITTAGSRYAINLLCGEAGGRFFCQNSSSMKPSCTMMSCCGGFAP